MNAEAGSAWELATKDDYQGAMAPFLNEKHALAQKALLDFLQADLDLCFTMLSTVGMASGNLHYHSSLRHVREGLLTIRRLSGRIEDPEAWKIVHERSDELERALEPFNDHSLEET